MDERTALVRILPDATVSIGWVVRTGGTTDFRLAEGYPTLFASERAYCLLLRDGAVRAFVRECSENWPEHVRPRPTLGRRGRAGAHQAASLTRAARRGRLRTPPGAAA